jgi:chitodextrinase
VNGLLINSGNRIIGTGTSDSRECNSPGNGSTSSNNWADNIYCETDQQTPASTYTLKTTAEILTAKGSLKPRSPSFSISPNNGYVSVNLNSRNNGGSSILNYEYSLNNAAFIALSPASGAVSTFDINGLTNGTTYAIKVRAINANGKSLPSISVDGTPAASAPGSPTISALRAVSSSSVALDFLAPASNGGSPITSYFCQALVGSFSVTLSQSTSGTCLFTGLSSNTTYSFRIRASNTSGSSAFTTSSNVTTPLSDAEQKIKDDEEKAENNRIRAAEIMASRAQLLALLEQGKAPSIELYWLAEIVPVNANTHAPINSQLLSMNVESRTAIAVINAVVYKQSVIDELVTAETLVITTSDLMVAELINSTTPQKTLICRIVADLPLSERNTLKEISAVISAHILQTQSRMDRLAAIKATLESRRSK